MRKIKLNENPGKKVELTMRVLFAFIPRLYCVQLHCHLEWNFRPLSFVGKSQLTVFVFLFFCCGNSVPRFVSSQ